MSKLARICMLVIGLLAVSQQTALAHPHEFVTMKTSALFNAKGAIVGLRYRWTFDEFFSAYALEGEDANANGIAEPAELQSLLSEILGNIKKINYFTKFDTTYSVPTFAKAKPISVKVKERQVVVNFEVSFTKPYSLRKNPLNYAVYDDEFYIAMQHDDGDAAIAPINAPAGCKASLEPPSPTEEARNFASSLDKTQSGGNDLGEMFAEWVTVSCQ